MNPEKEEGEEIRVRSSNEKGILGNLTRVEERERRLVTRKEEEVGR